MPTRKPEQTRGVRGLASPEKNLKFKSSELAKNAPETVNRKGNILILRPLKTKSYKLASMVDEN